MQSLSGRDDDCLTFDPWKDGMDGQVAARGRESRERIWKRKRKGSRWEPFAVLAGKGSPDNDFRTCVGLNAKDNGAPDGRPLEV